MSDDAREARTDPALIPSRMSHRGAPGPPVGATPLLSDHPLARPSDHPLNGTIVSDYDVEETLPVNAVRLSDGRVVTIRETTAYDDEQVIKALTSAGYNMANLAVPTLTRFTVFQAIDSVDGEPFRFPKGKTGLDALLMTMKGRDVVALTRCYARVQGMDDDEFRTE